MSNHNHNRFFNKTLDFDARGNQTSTYEKYLASLNEEQLQKLTDFYHKYCRPGYENPLYHPDDPILPLTNVSHGRTRHNVFYALNAANEPNSSPKDYMLVTCRKDGDTMVEEHYQIHDVWHAPSIDGRGLDKIVYAEREDGKRIGLELSATVHWLEEKDVASDHEEPYESIQAEPFKLP